LPYRADGNDLLIHVRATPGARTEGLDGIADGADGAQFLKVKVRAKPEDGKANAALIAVLAKAMNLPRSALTLESGMTSRIKTIRISGGAPLASRLSEIIA
jgi:uncharacterized protein (TIGR00251 family)